MAVPGPKAVHMDWAVHKNTHTPADVYPETWGQKNKQTEPQYGPINFLI